MQNKYVKEKCQVCGNELKEGDDIVVCPECGAPYHRECIKSVGECVYKDKHAEGFVFEVSDKPKNIDDVGAPCPTLECPRCGEQNPSSYTNCQVCQTPLKRETPRVQVTFNGQQVPFFMPFAVNPEEEFGGVKAKEISEFVGQNQRYFMPRFKFLSARSFSWNWGAFFFRSLYFMYRKMWLVGIIVFLLELILEAGAISALFLAFEGILSEKPYTLITDALSVCAIALQFASAAFANKLYCNHVIRKIKKLKETSKDENEYKTKLAKKGSTSVLGVFVLIALIILIGVGLGVLATYVPQLAQFLTTITEQMMGSM